MSLRMLPARRIVAHVADAAARWRNADFPMRVRATAAIEERLGYSTPVVEYALDRLFFGITEDALTAAITAELGSIDALDGFPAANGASAAWARGVERVAIVSSDTTIGVAVVPAILALCAKCEVTVKDRSDALVAAFFASLGEEHPAFATAAHARAWPGGSDADDALLADADVVVAFGGDAALRAIRDRCGIETRFVPFGHRVSIGRLTADDVAALEPAGAEAIARDALLYDGEGCLSLHALFAQVEVEALQRLGATIAAACERVSLEFPPSRRDAAREAATRAYRTLAAFRAAGGRGSVLRRGDATLVVGAPHDEPPPLLPRVLPILSVRADDDIAAYVEAQKLPVQALGVVRADDASIALTARIGAVRIAPFGTLQDPPLGGHHGGFPRIADFVRWIDRA